MYTATILSRLKKKKKKNFTHTCVHINMGRLRGFLGPDIILEVGPYWDKIIH